MQRNATCQVIGEGRVRPKLQDPKKRIAGFDEAEPTMTLEEAQAEASRCARSTACLYCDVCELLCPDLAITRDEKSGHILVDLDFCKGCGLCAHYCPHGAIEMVVDE